MYFDEKLFELRAKAGLSQKELAQKLDINELAYDSLETGFKEPSDEELSKIAAFFSVAVDSLKDDEQATNIFSILFENSDMTEADMQEPLAMASALGAKISTQNQSDTPKKLLVKVPVLKNISYEDEEVHFDYANFELEIATFEKSVVALKLDKTIKELNILENDIVIVKKSDTIEKDNLYLILTDKQATISKVDGNINKDHFIYGKIIELIRAY